MTLETSWGMWDRYVAAVRRDAHQLLAWGYEDARPEIGPEDDEPSISGLIAEAIERRLDTVAPARFDRYSVADDTPKGYGGRRGNSRRRVDFVLERSGTRPRLRYIFEAKRLRRGTHPLSRYTGVDGIGRFVSGSYAPEAAEAAMLGYVQSPTVEQWEQELGEIFHEPSARQSLAVLAGLDPGPVVESLRHSWLSRHERASVGREISLYHVLLDCGSNREDGERKGVEAEP